MCLQVSHVWYVKYVKWGPRVIWWWWWYWFMMVMMTWFHMMLMMKLISWWCFRWGSCTRWWSESDQAWPCCSCMVGWISWGVSTSTGTFAESSMLFCLPRTLPAEGWVSAVPSVHASAVFRTLLSLLSVPVLYLGLLSLLSVPVLYLGLLSLLSVPVLYLGLCCPFCPCQCCI